MKNKKLFAILTLVCFMFTLMPVAAFAASPTYVEVKDECVYLTAGETVALDITNATTDSYYVFAINTANDKVYKSAFVEDDTITVGQGASDVVTYGTIDNAGKYQMYVIEKTPYTVAVQERYANAEVTAREAANLMIGASNVVMLSKDVTVKSEKSSYVLTFVDAKDVTGASVPAAQKQTATGFEVIPNSLVIGADSGYDEVTVTVQLNEATYDENGDVVEVGSAVVGATLDVDTNSYVIDVNKNEVKTNAAGRAEFVVTAATAGDFKIYVEYGSRTDLELFVKAGALDAAAIATTNQPSAPIALDSDVEDAAIRFAISDANGNSVSTGMVAGTNYRVVVSEAPTNSVLADAEVGDLFLVMGTKGWELHAAAGFNFDEEGDYTFKVVLDNGAYAIAKATVKEFQTPVALKLVYPTNAIELGGEMQYDELVYVDANGVTKDAGNTVELSASGYAVDSFTAANKGALVVSENEKYVGSVIKVIAVSEKYNLVDTVELTVANEAAGVKYFTTNADVAVNNTLVANVVDVDGNKVALTGTIDVDTEAYQIQYIVLDKPANSKVAISTKATTDLMSKGQFMVSFTASTAGEYKIQTVVRVTDDNEVVKYYSGIDTITVGGTGIKDVVVMSIGSDQIIINNDVEKMLCEAVIKDGRTMVPFRAGLEALGATVDYVAETQSVIAEMNGTKVVMTIGEKVYTVNGVAKTADVAPYLNAEASTTMVPASFVAKAFGINVNYTTNPDGTVADVLFAN